MFKIRSNVGQTSSNCRVTEFNVRNLSGLLKQLMNQQSESESKLKVFTKVSAKICG